MRDTICPQCHTENSIARHSDYWLFCLACHWYGDLVEFKKFMKTYVKPLN